MLVTNNSVFSQHPSGRLDWYLDNVLFNFNETNPSSFEYDISTAPLVRDGAQSESVHDWLSLQGLMDEPVIGRPLRFSESTRASAETWDMQVQCPVHVSAIPSFVQLHFIHFHSLNIFQTTHLFSIFSVFLI